MIFEKIKIIYKYSGDFINLIFSVFYFIYYFILNIDIEKKLLLRISHNKYH